MIIIKTEFAEQGQIMMLERGEILQLFQKQFLHPNFVDVMLWGHKLKPMPLIGSPLLRYYMNSNFLISSRYSRLQLVWD